MQKRKSLIELATAVEDMANSKRDFIVPSSKMEMSWTDNSLKFGDVTTQIGTVAHEQLSAKLDIPKRYYDKMRQTEPALLASNVNTWLQRSNEQRMVRVLGNQTRAILSDKYRPIDYDVILGAILPTLLSQGEELNIVSSEVTERKMYLQVVSNKLTGEVAKGDVVQMGINISSSDVGLGALNIEPYLYRLVCLNGAVMASAIRKYHVGKRIEADENGIFSTRTLEMDNAVFVRKIQETVQHSFDQIAFQKTLESVSFTAENKIVKAIPEVIKEVTKRYDFSKSEEDSILKNFINGASLTQWGLGNAITQMANEHEDYDRAIDYQKIGGSIIEMPPQTFRTIAG